MAALKERHLNKLRGSRFRKARRYLKRNPDAYVEMATHDGTFIVFGPPVYGDGAYDMADYPAMEITNRPNTQLLVGLQNWDENPGKPVEVPPVIDTAGTNLHACPVCDASGDDPCVTKTGNKAKQDHAGRNTL